MAEQFLSITEARKQLPTLSQAVQGDGDQFVITNLGKPQAVLLGYAEYKGLMAATELLNRPRDLEHLQEGLVQTEKLSFVQLKENLRIRRAEQNQVPLLSLSEERFEPLWLKSIGKTLDGMNKSLGRIKEALDASGISEHLQELIANSEIMRKEDYVEALRKIVAGQRRSVRSHKPAANVAKVRPGSAAAGTAAVDREIESER
jgi:prevent-host-death family protein